MKLPIQARPIMRSLNSVKISDALMRGVIASDCNSECGWAFGACAAIAILGPAAVAACLIGIGGTGCRHCYSDAVNASLGFIIEHGGGGGRPGEGNVRDLS